MNTRTYSMAEWAEHYTRRADGAQHDADKARQAGNLVDAERLDNIAQAYRADAQRCARKAEQLDDYRQSYGRQHRDMGA